jgi:hypothetical protein
VFLIGAAAEATWCWNPLVEVITFPFWGFVTRTRSHAFQRLRCQGSRPTLALGSSVHISIGGANVTHSFICDSQLWTSRQQSETRHILIIAMARFSGFLAALVLPLLASSIQLEVAITSPNGVLPNPSKLPSYTRAILSSLGPPLVAPITASNTFLFSPVPVGSYLLSVYSRDAVFEDLRVDVVKNETGESASSWTTFRGNEWNNKGELRGSGDGGSVQIEVRPLASKDYYQERSTCGC